MGEDRGGRTLGREINVKHYTRAEVERLRRANSEFVRSAFAGRQATLVGPRNFTGQALPEAARRGPRQIAVVTEGPRPWKRVRTTREEDYTILRIREDVFADPRDGSEHPRAIIEADEWTNVVALTTDDKIVMVRQFRFGSQSAELELPGGVVDAGETPAQAVARELEEETGYRPTSIDPVGWLWSNPAHFTNRVHIFVARGCERVHDGHLEDSEDLIVELVDRPAIPGLIRGGEIRHALHVAALYLARVADEAIG